MFLSHIGSAGRVFAGLFALIVWTLSPSVVHATLIIGQVDNFESGTTQNWSNGGHVPAPAVVLGGPGGSADHFLEVTADGSGPGGKLITFNRTQWLGDYESAGITNIAMDLKNLGASNLSMRIGFKETTANGAAGYVSSVPFSLPADSNWYHAVFSLDASAMTAISSPLESLSTLLAGPAEMRILDAVSPSLTGDVIVSVVGIDNITAVPEPSTLILMLLAGSAGIIVYASKKQIS